MVHIDSCPEIKKVFPIGKLINLRFFPGDPRKGDSKYIARAFAFYLGNPVDPVVIPVNSVPGLDNGTYVAEIVGYNRFDTALKVKVLGEAITDETNPLEIKLSDLSYQALKRGEVSLKVTYPFGVGDTKEKSYRTLSEVPSMVTKDIRFKEMYATSMKDAYDEFLIGIKESDPKFYYRIMTGKK